MFTQTRISCTGLADVVLEYPEYGGEVRNVVECNKDTRLVCSSVKVRADENFKLEKFRLSLGRLRPMFDSNKGAEC